MYTIFIRGIILSDFANDVKLFLYLMISFFRARDLAELAGNPADEAFPHTSLELAFISANSQILGENKWVDYFGDSPDLVQGSACSGQGDGAWPWPEVETGTDLAAVVSRGAFRCGYTPFIASTSDGITLINMTSEDGDTGRVPAYYSEIMSTMALHYNTSIKLEWVIIETSDGVFEALESNEVDAACGYWYPDGTVADSVGGRVARGLAFSMMPCTTLLKTDYVHVLTSSLSTRRTWDGLVQDINELREGDLPAVICVPDEPTSGLLPGCTELFAQYTGGNAICQPMPEADGPDYNAVAFQKLLDGECFGVYSGSLPEGTDDVSSVRQPGLLPPVTFFRNNDVVDDETSTSPPNPSTNPDPGSPTQAPTPTPAPSPSSAYSLGLVMSLVTIAVAAVGSIVAL